MSKKEKRFTASKVMLANGGQLVSILTDQTTGVQYLLANGSGVTVLVDKNGKPLLADSNRVDD